LFALFLSTWKSLFSTDRTKQPAKRESQNWKETRTTDWPVSEEKLSCEEISMGWMVELQLLFHVYFTTCLSEQGGYLYRRGVRVEGWGRKVGETPLSLILGEESRDEAAANQSRGDPSYTQHTPSHTPRHLSASFLDGWMMYGLTTVSTPNWFPPSSNLDYWNWPFYFHFHLCFLFFNELNFRQQNTNQTFFGNNHFLLSLSLACIC